MIKLVKEDYCEGCEYFTPTADHFINDRGEQYHLVRCEMYNICKNICEFIKNKNNVEKGEMKMCKIESDKIINLTPHDVNIVDEDGNIIKTFEKSGDVARCVEEASLMGSINGIDCFDVDFGEIEDLPPEETGTFYIVSAIIKRAGDDIGRQDLLVPYNTYRDENGNIIGCRAFGY